MRGGNGADSDRIRDVAFSEPRQNRRRPGGGGEEEGAALGSRLQKAFAAEGQGGAKFRQFRQRRPILGRRRAMTVAQQDSVSAAATLFQDIHEPGDQTGSAARVPPFDRPFEAVAIGETSCWEGRRQPGKQAQKPAVLSHDDGRGRRDDGDGRQCRGRRRRIRDRMARRSPPRVRRDLRPFRL